MCTLRRRRGLPPFPLGSPIEGSSGTVEIALARSWFGRSGLLSVTDAEGMLMMARHGHLQLGGIRFLIFVQSNLAGV